MKKLLTFLCAASLAFAAANSSADELSELENLRTLSADFTQTNTIKDFGEDSYSGRLYVVSKEKALWDYTDPYEAWYLFSRNEIKQYDSVNNQLMIYSGNEADDNVLLRLLTDMGSVKKEFKITKNGSSYELIPMKNLGVVSVTLDFENGVISGMKSEDPAGNVSEITFTNVKVNEPIDKSVFLKSAPPDAEVFESR